MKTCTFQNDLSGNLIRLSHTLWMTNFYLVTLLDFSCALRNEFLWFHGRLSNVIAFQNSSAVKECVRTSMVVFFLDNIAGLNLSLYFVQS